MNLIDENQSLVTTFPNNSYGSSYQDIPLDSGSRRNNSNNHTGSGNPGMHSDNQNEADVSHFKNQCIGYSFVFFINIGYTISLITAQLAIGQVSIWQLNFMRFAFEAIVALIMILCSCYSVKIKSKDVGWFLLMMVAYYLYSTCYYLAPSMLPVGTMQAIFTTMLILFAVTIDILMKSVHRLTVLGAIVCVSGLLLLIQPWDFELHDEIYSVTPCYIWDIGCDTQSVDLVNATCLINGSLEHLHLGYNTAYLFGFSVDGTITGYLLIFAGALSLCIMFNLVRKMSFVYPVPVIVFWTDILLTFLSVVVTASIEGGHWKFPSGLWCRITVISFILSTVIDNLLCFHGYHYLPVSQVTLGVAPTTLSLYICQQTFLKVFHPGHSNVIEQFGVCLIVIGSSLAQLLSVVGDCGKFCRSFRLIRARVRANVQK